MFHADHGDGHAVLHPGVGAGVEDILLAQGDVHGLQHAAHGVSGAFGHDGGPVRLDGHHARPVNLQVGGAWPGLYAQPVAAQQGAAHQLQHGLRVGFAGAKGLIYTAVGQAVGVAAVRQQQRRQRRRDQAQGQRRAAGIKRIAAESPAKQSRNENLPLSCGLHFVNDMCALYSAGMGFVKLFAKQDEKTEKVYKSDRIVTVDKPAGP